MVLGPHKWAAEKLIRATQFPSLEISKRVDNIQSSTHKAIQDTIGEFSSAYNIRNSRFQEAKGLNKAPVAIKESLGTIVDLGEKGLLDGIPATVINFGSKVLDTAGTPFGSLISKDTGESGFNYYDYVSTKSIVDGKAMEFNESRLHQIGTGMRDIYELALGVNQNNLKVKTGILGGFGIAKNLLSQSLYQTVVDLKDYSLGNISKAYSGVKNISFGLTLGAGGAIYSGLSTIAGWSGLKTVAAGKYMASGAGNLSKKAYNSANRVTIDTDFRDTFRNTVRSNKDGHLLSPWERFKESVNVYYDTDKPDRF